MIWGGGFEIAQE